MLWDEDGGVDAINASPVTSDSLIDLSGATESSIAGVSLTIRDPGSIENAFGGDGDDTLVGTDGDNLLSGGRGDDALHYSGGSDTIEGGEGTDTLYIASISTVIEGAFSDPYTFLMRQGDDTALSQVSGVEFFAFEDVTYSVSELIVIYGEGEVPAEVETPDEVVEEEPVAAQPEPEPEPEPGGPGRGSGRGNAGSAGRGHP